MTIICPSDKLTWHEFCSKSRDFCKSYLCSTKFDSDMQIMLDFVKLCLIPFLNNMFYVEAQFMVKASTLLYKSCLFSTTYTISLLYFNMSFHSYWIVFSLYLTEPTFFSNDFLKFLQCLCLICTEYLVLSMTKFIYSEKATFCKIFTLLLSYVVPVKSKVKI